MIIFNELQEMENKLALYSKSAALSPIAQSYLTKAHLEILKAMKIVEDNKLEKRMTGSGVDVDFVIKSIRNARMTARNESKKI